MENIDVSLKGARILVVEDEYFQADDLVRALGLAGAETVGPVGTLAEAEHYLEAETLDGAVLDMNLRGLSSVGLVKMARRMGVPCLIVSGYSGEALPPALADTPRLEKPVNPRAIVVELGRLISAV